MLKVFESIGVVDEARNVREILPFVRAYGFISAEDLWSKVMNTMNRKDFKDAINSALEGKLVEIVTRTDGKKGLSPLA